MAACTPSTLWAARLSAITMSPGCKVGTRICSTEARKRAPSIGPSRTPGAVSPVTRSAAMKVLLSHRPWGAWSATRWPRSPRPYRRKRLVATPLSSRKTRWVGSRVGAVAAHCARAAAMSGRSRSEARIVFFRVKPSWFTARQMVVRLADVARAPFSSARVRSGCSRISAASVCSWGASTGRRPYRCWRGATSPVSRRRCLSRRTQEALTWYLPATADAFMPVSLSRRRRSRRSIE